MGGLTVLETLMKTLLALAFLAGLALPALAGDEPAGRCLDGFDCDNACPLAHQANERRATGTEALALSPALRSDLAAQLRRNLGKI
jgi:hypothetical protein